MGGLSGPGVEVGEGWWLAVVEDFHRAGSPASAAASGRVFQVLSSCRGAPYMDSRAGVAASELPLLRHISCSSAVGTPVALEGGLRATPLKRVTDIHRHSPAPEGPSAFGGELQSAAQAVPGAVSKPWVRVADLTSPQLTVRPHLRAAVEWCLHLLGAPVRICCAVPTCACAAARS